MKLKHILSCITQKNKSINLMSCNSSGGIVISDNIKGNNMQINCKDDKAQIIIDGVDVTHIIKELGANITINGNIENFQTVSFDVHVNGDCGSLKTVSGDVTIEKNCNGNIGTVSGDVEIHGNHTGKISTISGDIDCN